MEKIEIKDTEIYTKNSKDTQIGVIGNTKTEPKSEPESDNIKLADKIIKNKGFIISVLVLILTIVIVYKI